MSNNKPKSSVTPVNQHLQNKAQPNPKDVIAAAKAAQEAKLEAAAKAEAEAKKSEPKAPAEPTAKPDAEPKAPVSTESDKAVDAEPKAEPEASKDSDSDDKKPRKRLKREEWVAILAKKEREGLTAAQIADEHGVTEGNVYQWASKLKSELEADAKEAEANELSAANFVDYSLKLLQSVNKKLEAFDAKVAEAQAFIDNSAKERKFIEDSKIIYIDNIEKLGTDEDKAKAKEVAVEVAVEVTDK